MKKRIPAFILMLSLFVTGAFAANAYKKSIEVEYGISLSINGQTPTLTDVNGKIVQPFVYQGTTYVPIRAVGENLGASVNYDENSNRATLVSANQTSAITKQDILILSAIEEMEDISNAYINIGDSYSIICSRILSGTSYSSLLPSLNSLISSANSYVQPLKNQFNSLSPYMISGMYDDLIGNVDLLEDCAYTAQLCQDIVNHLNSNPYDYDAVEDLMDCYSLLQETAIFVGTSAEKSFNQWTSILTDNA